ncbi:CD24 isoform 4, partial [Pongo abelii]
LSSAAGREITLPEGSRRPPPTRSHWNSRPLSGPWGAFCSLGGNAFAPGPAATPPQRRRGLFFWGIYSIETTTGISINTSQSTSNFGTAPNPTNATTKAAGGALQSTASLFVVSLSLLHLYC